VAKNTTNVSYETYINLNKGDQMQVVYLPTAPNTSTLKQVLETHSQKSFIPVVIILFSCVVVGLIIMSISIKKLLEKTA
jgi:uncharacterized transporter YbjL